MEVEPTETEITTTTDNSIGYAGTETEKIKQKVFILSATELGYSSEVNMADEGKRIDCYGRIRSSADAQMLRTPNTYDLNASYVVFDDGKIDVMDSYNEFAVWPAFCVESLDDI